MSFTQIFAFVGTEDGLIESAGVAFLTFQDSSDVKHAMFVTLMACWPVVVLSLVMAYIAGLIMWLLVSCD